MSALAVSLGRRRVLRKDTVQECGGDGAGSMSDPLRSRVSAELKSRQKASAAQRPDPAGQAERWAPLQFHPNAPGVLTTEPCLKGCLVCVLLFSFLAAPHGSWDPNPLTRDRTLVPCSGNMESSPLDCKGSPCLNIFTDIYSY